MYKAIFQRRHPLSFLLSVILLLQGLFPLASHTQLVRNDQGQLVQVCTLEGIRSYTLDDSGQLAKKIDHSDNQQRSAAIEFSALLAEAIPAVPEIPYFRAAGAVYSKSPAVTSLADKQVIGLQPVRARPVLFI